MMLVSLISYIDRNTLAILSPTILKESRLSDEQYGWIISAFSVAYMIANPLWGRLLDRFGLWIGMFAAVGLWSLASASHALAAGFVGFAAARVLLGFGEGATFPGGLRTATQTLPPEQRARGIALAYSGGSLGAILTPLIVTPVALAFGWRAAFLLTGLLGASWLFLWWRLRDERALGEAAPSVAAERIRFGDLRLWGFIALYAGGGLPLGFVLYAAPIYLHQGLHQSQAQLGHILWIPPLGWEVGYFFWGWLADRLTRARDPRPAYRALVAALALLGSTLALTPSLTPLPMVMAELFLAMFVAAGFVIVAIAYATWAFSTRQSGFIAGVGAGSWSAVVALTMPLFGRLFDAHDYRQAFLIATVVPFGGSVVWWLLDRIKVR
ncbi:MAG: major facilitator superfamily 1 [Myxococcales bacterium]|nr:major facilitator superfamily 1 [Myxococcales bacterium]